MKLSAYHRQLLGRADIRVANDAAVFLEFSGGCGRQIQHHIFQQDKILDGKLGLELRAPAAPRHRRAYHHSIVVRSSRTASAWPLTPAYIALGFPCAHTYAQTPPKPIRRSGRYEDSFITERRPFKWPGNNTLAVWFAPNVEVWHYDFAFGVGVAPNPTNYYLTSTTTPGANTGSGSACGASRMCSTKPA